jgi:hypothetical protein
LTAKRDLASPFPEQPRYSSQERSLAGSVRTDDTADLTLPDRQVEAVNDHRGAVREPQVGYVEQNRIPSLRDNSLWRVNFVDGHVLRSMAFPGFDDYETRSTIQPWLSDSFSRPLAFASAYDESVSPTWSVLVKLIVPTLPA